MTIDPEVRNAVVECLREMEREFAGEAPKDGYFNWADRIIETTMKTQAEIKLVDRMEEIWDAAATHENITFIATASTDVRRTVRRAFFEILQMLNQETG